MLHKTLKPIKDDTEDAPWTVVGMPQFEAVYIFYDSLRHELGRRPERPLVAAMLPILDRPLVGWRVEQLAPDVLVASVAPHLRNSYDVEREGIPPSFVLEVMSRESRSRDLRIKPERYALIGVREYAIFAPEMPDGKRLLDPPLQGYRLDPGTSDYVPWQQDSTGRLHSETLELWLTVRDGILRAQRPDGTLVPTPQELEAEVERLRAELERKTDSI